MGRLVCRSNVRRHLASSRAVVVVSGKSSITRRCCGLAFDEHYDPTTISIQRRIIRIEDTSFLLDIVDTAGQVRATLVWRRTANIIV